MRNYLYLITLAFLASCTAQKTVESKPLPAPADTLKTANADKPEVKHNIRGDYYTVNIADPAKNDNTISYGSIVSAQPQGYTISKEFFPAIAQNFRQKYIVLHYTALDLERSIRVLGYQSVSSHYLVNDDNNKEIIQLVDENKRAYHAGVSYWRGDRNINDTSIGIEIVNPGYTSDSSGIRTYAPYPEYQYRKVAALLKDLADRYMIPPTNIVGHSDIAPMRKQDPGPLFPWKRLYTEYGIGMWYDTLKMHDFYDEANDQDFAGMIQNPSFIFKTQAQLQDLGYGLEQSGQWDAQTKAVLEAFQARFRPEKMHGQLDAETWAILQALLYKYPAAK